MLWAVSVVLIGSTSGDPRKDNPVFTDVPPSDQFTAKIYDFLLLPTVQMISGQSAVMTDGHVPFYRTGHYGTYNPNIGPRFTERWLQYKILMAESFTDFFILLDFGKPAPKSGKGNAAKDNTFFLDQLVTLMSRFVESRKWTLLLVVGCQIFLDINLILGKDTKRGQTELRQIAGRMVKTLKSRKAVEGDTPPNNWPMTNEIAIEHFVADAEFWRDYDFRALARRIPETGGSGCILVERSPVLWSSPVQVETHVPGNWIHPRQRLGLDRLHRDPSPRLSLLERARATKTARAA